MARSRKSSFKLSQTDALLIAGAGAVGVVALIVSAHASPSPPSGGTVSRLTINSDYSSTMEGGVIQFTGLALDSNNNGVENAVLYFIENGQSTGSNTVTTQGGAYSFQVTFAVNPGTYGCHVSTAP